MQTSVVIGAFQFIGFHIARHLLDQGEEVVGIDWKGVSDGAIMEKEMEIGRNSNFLYIPIDRLHQISIIRPKNIYISCYDLRKSCIEDKEKVILHVIAFLKAIEINHDSQVIVLLPIEEDYSVYDSLLRAIEDNDLAKLVYIPTIYGPWQPETMSFEAAIRQKELSEIESAILKEDKSDALFISDLVDALIKISSHHEKKIYLQSETPDQWKQCAKLLWKEEWINNYINTCHTQPIRGFLYKVKNKTTPIEGISLQKKHVQLLKKWKEND